MNKAILDGDRAEADNIYENGKFSRSGATTFRTLRGLGLKVPDQSTVYTFNQQIAVLGQGWADEWKTYLWDVSGFCSDLSTPLAKEGCAAVMSDAMIEDFVIPYASYEFGDCVYDCASGELFNNVGNVKACDEGVCFWAGADQAPTEGGSKSGYSLAEDGVQEFGYIPGSAFVLQQANGMNAMTLGDAVYNQGQSMVNSMFMSNALKAQSSSKNEECTKFPGKVKNTYDVTSNLPKKLNLAVSAGGGGEEAVVPVERGYDVHPILLRKLNPFATPITRRSGAQRSRIPHARAHLANAVSPVSIPRC
jgi:hypothetical protein